VQTPSRSASWIHFEGLLGILQRDSGFFANSAGAEEGTMPL
jgi:hypothetical protein